MGQTGCPHDGTLDHENIFLNVNASKSVLVDSMISLSYVLRLRMEIVRPGNVNAGSEFYPHEFFHESAVFENFLKTIEIFEFLKRKKKREVSCSTSSRAGTRLTVHSVLE